MRRREFVAILGGMATAWPLGVQARQPARLAWIGSGTAAVATDSLAAFREGMSDNGLVEGKDYVLDLFWSEGYYERFPALVQAALARDPAILLVVTIASVRAAQQAKKTSSNFVNSTFYFLVLSGQLAETRHHHGNGGERHRPRCWDNTQCSRFWTRKELNGRSPGVAASSWPRGCDTDGGYLLTLRN